MKKVIIAFVLMLLLSSFISADTSSPTSPIIFNQAVNPIYNLGDTIPVPVTIKTLTDISGMFSMGIICNGTEMNFYKNGIKMVAGEERTLDPSIVLIKEMIGSNTGTCVIKATLGSDFLLTSEFRISNFLSIEISPDKKEYKPGEGVSISGKATKENSLPADGFLEAEIVTGDLSQNTSSGITQFGTINTGYFSMNASLPANLAAGTYLVNIKAYEKDVSGEITNSGFAQFNISVIQVPVNLELILENQEINPGEVFRARTILHDQTGSPMDGIAFITIKDKNDKIYEQKDIKMNETFDYQIKKDQAPEDWKVFAVSSQLTAESGFTIKENEKIDVSIINKTIQITNIGNVPYNKTLLVKVGDTPLNIDISLNVGQSKKYILSAPDGEYKVQVVSDTGDEFSDITTLTGKAVSIKEASGGILSLMEHPFLWIFVLLILGFVAFTIFRKVHKKPFFGFGNPLSYFKKKDTGAGNKDMTFFNSKFTPSSSSKAELSLSIRGDKQDASVVCVHIKNLREMSSKKGSASDVIQNIIETAEANKAVTYENQDYLFFILAPARTRTYKNDKNALDIAENIMNSLKEHNKMFSQKIDFGISVNIGTIVAKQENTFKFMSMGTLITACKKIASLSKGEILLSEKINDIVRMHVKTEKRVREGVPLYVIKEIKRENEQNKKFIKNFVDKLEREKRG